MSNRQLILDTETTGLSPDQGHRVIEIGVVEMIDRKLTGNDWHMYLNPERQIDPSAMAVHGIKNEFLIDKPKFEEVAQEFIDYIDDCEIIIHNAPFDLKFLNMELGLVKISVEGLIQQRQKIIDTLIMARKLHPGQRNSLDALCKRYQVNNSHRSLHGALLDSQILAEVYLAMTGGQMAMFGESDKKTEASPKRSGSIKTPHKLLIVEPSEQEKSLHQKYFEDQN